MPTRRLTLLLLLALSAATLAGCGRKGPLELPEDVQAERLERAKQQQEADAAQARTSGKKPSFSQEDATPKISNEGDRGHRPPDKYPFPLDPLLQ